MVEVGSVSVRDEKQAVRVSDEHAGAALMVDLGAAERWPAQRHVSQEPPTLPQKILTTVHEGSAGRIHHAADVEQTIVLELPWRQPAG